MHENQSEFESFPQKMIDYCDRSQDALIEVWEINRKFDADQKIDWNHSVYFSISTWNVIVNFVAPKFCMNGWVSLIWEQIDLASSSRSLTSTTLINFLSILIHGYQFSKGSSLINIHIILIKRSIFLRGFLFQCFTAIVHRTLLFLICFSTIKAIINIQ